MKSPYEKPPHGKPGVCGNEDRSRSCRGPVAHSKGIYRGVEEDTPAHRHKAYLGKTSEKYAAGAQDGNGDDGVVGEVELVGDEEREDDR